MRKPTLTLALIALLLVALLIATFLLSGQWGKAASKTKFNPVAQYLSGAEIQGEPSQTSNIKRALRDMLTLSEKELRQQRYADYEGHEGRWTAEDVVHRHIVPLRGSDDLGPNFYHDVKEPSAQAAVQQLLKSNER